MTTTNQWLESASLAAGFEIPPLPPALSGSLEFGIRQYSDDKLARYAFDLIKIQQKHGDKHIEDMPGFAFCVHRGLLEKTLSGWRGTAKIAKILTQTTQMMLDKSRQTDYADRARKGDCKMDNAVSAENYGETSLLERLRRLNEERDQLLTGARSELLLKINQGIDELNRLGYSYRLTGEHDDSPQGNSLFFEKQETVISDKKRQKREKKDLPCSVCGFKTDPLHDGRAHRNHPAVFTDDELLAKGWNRVN